MNQSCYSNVPEEDNEQCLQCTHGTYNLTVKWSENNRPYYYDNYVLSYGRVMVFDTAPDQPKFTNTFKTIYLPLVSENGILVLNLWINLVKNMLRRLVIQFLARFRSSAFKDFLYSF